MRDIRKVFMVAVIATIVGSSLFFTTGVLADPGPKKAYVNVTLRKAYVMIGDVSGGEWYCRKAAEEAKKDYKKANYTVIFIENATKQDVINATKDNETRAIWIIAHGEPGVEEFTMADYLMITEVDFANQTFPNITQVTLHSCGQKLKSWKDLFPKANFESWSGKARFWFIYAWQLWISYQSNASAPIPEIHPTLQPESCFGGGGIANDFPLYEPLKSQFGSQNFNFYAIDTSTNESQILFGADIENGTIVGSYVNGTAEPTFNVSVTNEALFQILEQPSTIWDAYTEGDVQIIPYVAVEEDILFKGMARLIFGVREISVGGIVEFPDIEEPGTAIPDSSEHNYGALAGIIVGAIVGTIMLISAVWYARRRWFS